MTAFIVTTVQTIKTFSKWNRTLTRISRIPHNRLPCTHIYNTLGSQPCLQFALFCCLLMFTALIPVSNTVLHRFTSTLTPHCAFPQLNPLHSLPSTLVTLLYATHWLAMTWLSISRCPLALHAAYSISRIYYSLPVSAGYPVLKVSVSFS
jgi:hypothetical protein